MIIAFLDDIIVFLDDIIDQKTILSFFERYYHPENDNIVFWTIISSWMKISAERYYRYYHFQCNFIVFLDDIIVLDDNFWDDNIDLDDNIVQNDNIV